MKDDDVCLKAYEGVGEVRAGLGTYLDPYGDGTASSASGAPDPASDVRGRKHTDGGREQGKVADPQLVLT